MDTLATVDVCVSKVDPTIFCDKEGYDLVPFRMVSIIQEPLESTKTYERNINTTNEVTEVLFVKEENSICDKSQKEEEVHSSNEDNELNKELFYDASDEMEDFQEVEPMVIQLRDGRQIEVQEKTKDMFAKQRKRKYARSKGKKTMPKFQNKTHYLMGIKAIGKVKDKLIRCY